MKVFKVFTPWGGNAITLPLVEGINVMQTPGKWLRQAGDPISGHTSAPGWCCDSFSESSRCLNAYGDLPLCSHALPSEVVRLFVLSALRFAGLLSSGLRYDFCQLPHGIWKGFVHSVWLFCSNHQWSWDSLASLPNPAPGIDVKITEGDALCPDKWLTTLSRKIQKGCWLLSNKLLKCARRARRTMQLPARLFPSWWHQAGGHRAEGNVTRGR